MRARLAAAAGTSSGRFKYTACKSTGANRCSSAGAAYARSTCVALQQMQPRSSSEERLHRPEKTRQAGDTSRQRSHASTGTSRMSTGAHALPIQDASCGGGQRSLAIAASRAQPLNAAVQRGTHRRQRLGRAQARRGWRRQRRRRRGKLRPHLAVAASRAAAALGCEPWSACEQRLERAASHDHRLLALPQSESEMSPPMPASLRLGQDLPEAHVGKRHASAAAQHPQQEV